ncbi:MAG: phosphoribosylaminoimidazolesuccinocarboxamide synthase [Actinobacteria bacterium]|nr:phosphoribosylaminoimidazolesuccinocarboxamide synthase [Actinomycetota bacterium]HRY11293.1 phosphoribosylaminoimidazolesuccinocarboxamide synthase [Candidatus Nanopelagicales bacterium]
MTVDRIPGWDHVYSGKVRDLYADDGRLLFVASDRISAFDWVLPTPIPDKGRILTQVSLWWFDQLRDIVDNHVVSADVPAQVAGRALLCERLEMLPVECVVRGYLSGSGWVDYQATGSVCGVALPGGLQESQELPDPIFTPATKADIGEHDENIDFDRVVSLIGRERADAIRDLSLRIYDRARGLAADRGLILADTKFEFGVRPDGTIVLADEVLTPDSSRYWDVDTWAVGSAPPSYDKQFVRDWLRWESGWDPASDSPPPPLPPEVVARTRAKYVQAYETLTGKDFV